MGAPLILQSDNGREFKNKHLFKVLNDNFPSTRIIHGKPRHPETQGSVERANQDIKRHFTAMMLEKGSNSWVDFVRQVQYTKNTSYHTTLDITPFQALFHRKPSLGLAELGVLEEIVNTIQSEDDLVQAVDKVNSRTEEVSDGEGLGSSVWCNRCDLLRSRNTTDRHKKAARKAA